ncbi:DUF4012 domain-containing protein [Sulfobacillus harzensis]|uniref:DUF4012 domain-containing protein n=1 Tax=Sulfobacillus harzensis TaxID=2729629 RepID=UPI001FAE731F|nr:DUF4012 domain-containing protein [Sulfobacillus harzensis]
MAHSPRSRQPRRRRWVWRSVFGLVLALVVAFVVAPGLVLAHQVLGLKKTVSRLEAGNRAHNFGAVAQQINTLESEIAHLRRTLGWVSYLRWVPGGVGQKYRDGQDAVAALNEGMKGVHVLLPALARIAPLAGYHVGHTHVRSGQQKIQAFVSQLAVLVPDLTRAYPDFKAANYDLALAHPQDFSGYLAPVGKKLLTAQSLINTVVKNMPLVDHSAVALQSILGYPHAKRYLLIFQNSGELRATGGFMTAYGYVTVDRGKLASIKAQNMYLLDAEVTYHPPASTVIATYLPVYYWHLRDANTSPNVPTTVQYIKRFYASIPGAPPVDGIIFIDTWFVDKLIGDVGGITVPTPKGPVQLNAQNANMKMEYMAEGQGLPDSVRKKFIGTMMKTLFHDVFHSHGLELARVLKTVNQSLNQKFILLNFNNPAAQKMVEEYNWGGVMDKNVSGDYLSVVDENLLGHKDNYVMSYHITTQVRRVHGRYQETSRITYRDPAVDNGWLFVPYHSWVRFYVPLGSTLISITGVDGIPPETYNNTVVNKTVFGGHVDLPARNAKTDPVATHTVTVRYWLPPGVNPARLTVQLQPGVNHQTLTVEEGAVTRTVAFTHDMIFHFPS